MAVLTDMEVDALFQHYCSAGFRAYQAFYMDLSEDERTAFDFRVNRKARFVEAPIRRSILSLAWLPALPRIRRMLF